MQPHALFFTQPARLPHVGGESLEENVTKPPKSTPHSDIDGVHEDERRNVDTAVQNGQDSGDVERAAEEAVGRPPHSDEGEEGREGGR